MDRQHSDHPSKQKFWDVDLGNRVFAPRTAISISEPMDAASFLEIKPGDVKVLELEDWCIAGAKQRLEAAGRNVDQESHRLVAKAIAAAVQRASLTLAQFARGEAQPSSWDGTDLNCDVSAQDAHEVNCADNSRDECGRDYGLYPILLFCPDRRASSFICISTARLTERHDTYVPHGRELPENDFVNALRL